MQKLTLEQASDYIETAMIERTHDDGHEVIHVGVNVNGQRFILVNHCLGETFLGEGI